MSRGRALTSCSSAAGCPNLTRSGLCWKCRRKRKQFYDLRRPGARERGYDTRWEITRAAFLAEHPDCDVCGVLATDVDHRDGLGPLGPDGHTHSNLRALCHSHHSARTARDQPGGWNR